MLVSIALVLFTASFVAAEHKQVKKFDAELNALLNGAKIGRDKNRHHQPVAKMENAHKQAAASTATTKSSDSPADIGEDVKMEDLFAAKTKQGSPQEAPIRALGGATMVVVRTTAEHGHVQALQSKLHRLGATHVSCHGDHCSCSLPTKHLGALADAPELRSATASRAQLRSGLVTSQAVPATYTDLARQLTQVADGQLDGSGVIVGILSDSFDCGDKSIFGLGGSLKEDQESGDLPANVTILSEIDDCTFAVDEGRAMAQLVHDTAPGASILFYSAANGYFDVADGFDALREAGADIIVDDFLYVLEPVYMDGIIAQAAQRAVDDGVAVFSAAGNDFGAAYEASFVAGVSLGPFEALHRFGNIGSVAQQHTARLVVGPQADFCLFLQYSQSSAVDTADGAEKGPDTDLDLLAFAVIFDEVVQITPYEFFDDFPISTFEQACFANPFDFAVTVRIAVGKRAGPSPARLHALLFTFDGFVFISDPNLSGNIFPDSYGHANAAGVVSTAAAAYFQTPAFGVSPPVVEPFSSQGGIPILLDVNGNELPEPEVRNKPELTCIDGVDTTFFDPFSSDPDFTGFPNFFGTSASAPNAAAIAALMLEANRHLTPAEITDALQRTAIDMDDPFTPGFDVGFDFRTGAGLCHAQPAVNDVQASTTTITARGNEATVCVRDGSVFAGTCNGEMDLRKRVLRPATRTVIETTLQWRRVGAEHEERCSPRVELFDNGERVAATGEKDESETGVTDMRVVLDLIDGTHTFKMVVKSIGHCGHAKLVTFNQAIDIEGTDDVEVDDAKFRVPVPGSASADDEPGSLSASERKSVVSSLLSSSSSSSSFSSSSSSS